MDYIKRFFWLLHPVCAPSTLFYSHAFDRQVTQLLKEIIFFVGDDQYNGGGKHGDPLEMEFTISDRERQKLLREQNILKQVGALTNIALINVHVISQRKASCICLKSCFRCK